MTTSMTPEAKSRLSNKIYKLREGLLTGFHNAADSAYLLSLPFARAAERLTEESRIRRKRLEEWLAEQTRRENGGQKKGKKDSKEIRENPYYQAALKLAAATFLNRIVVIRHMEAVELVKPAVVTGGWNSAGYREFRDFAPALLKDETEGYSVLLGLLFDELAVDLPGLFGNVGITGLFPVPAPALREVVEALDDSDLESVWRDDTTLGWVYQFWNDPERKALDEKISNRGKIERHEIAAKTQLFTERYMVEWLLQNSLNNLWLAICRKNGWEPRDKADGTLAALEKRRAEWREKREQGEVAPETMMPIESDAEERWKYWVSQELSQGFVDAAPDSVRDLKILDPAVGSGHFWVIAFSLLTAFYREEADHRGEEWSDKWIAESIIENNLHGIDLDPRAVQIAAAAIWLKAKAFCREASPRFMNLVASNLGLAALPEDDPAVQELKVGVREATGIPEELTEKIIEALKGADYLGSLLKIDETVDEAIREHESSGKALLKKQKQGDVFEGFAPDQKLLQFDRAKLSVLEKLDRFLIKCTESQDLGLRLRGEQLAAGVRFIRLLKQWEYHIVVANPPYQGTSSLIENRYIQQKYPTSKPDLYSAFLVRGIELCRNGGCSAMVTLRGWMFIKQYDAFREYMLEKDLRLIGDLESGAFEMISGEVVSAVMSIFYKQSNSRLPATALKVTDEPTSKTYSTNISIKKSNLLTGNKSFVFEPEKLKIINGQPLIYWWNDKFIDFYSISPKFGTVYRVKKGATTSNNHRFIRFPWEVEKEKIALNGFDDIPDKIWAPYILGAKGKSWYEPLDHVILWKSHGLEVKTYNGYLYGSYTRSIQNQDSYFKTGIAFATIGNKFSARIYRFRSIFDSTGSSLFPSNLQEACCLLNTTLSKNTLASLNPTIHFKNYDIDRLPYYNIKYSNEIFNILNKSFVNHENSRETSIEFQKPSSSQWKHAQHWAQKAVDAHEDTPLPEYNPIYEAPPPTNHISFAIGITLGRFGANGEGILDKAPKTALPNGILYLSANNHADSLSHPASQPIKEAWEDHGKAVAPKSDLKAWLMQKFFKDVHLDMYEKRPIYFPLSSKKKNFVSFISIHRWTDNTLQTLLADHLIPELNRLDGNLQDLFESRRQRDAKARSDAENQFALVSALHDELEEFIALVRQCADEGPPPAKHTDTPRETDAPYKMDLDDGVMINSAALWPLLEPQWKDPKKWWSELCNAEGRKDYDWSRLAARYFPARVDEKCQNDPSLAVAHGCFWKYHPEKAYQWELRLQDEIEPWFTIDEQDSDGLSANFEENNRARAEELIATECRRRERNRAKAEREAGADGDEEEDNAAENGWEADPLFADGGEE